MTEKASAGSFRFLDFFLKLLPLRGRKDFLELFDKVGVAQAAAMSPHGLLHIPDLVIAEVKVLKGLPEVLPAFLLVRVSRLVLLDSGLTVEQQAEEFDV